MDENICKSVDEDITFAKQQWEKYSHDYEKMETLYNKLLFNYNHIVENFAKDLTIISLYENKNKLAEVYRNNITLLINRLCAFKNNGYKNKSHDSVDEYEYKRQLTNLFNEVRFQIMSEEKISATEKEDVINNIDSIEQIALMPISKEDRWDRLRPYIIWLSGKTLCGAGYVFRIFDYIGKELDYD